mgnify:CR=1 FL=1
MALVRRDGSGRTRPCGQRGRSRRATRAAASSSAAGARSTAYLPLPLSVWVAEGRGGFALGCGVAFLVPFVVGCASNALEVQKAALTGKLPAKQK